MIGGGGGGGWKIKHQAVSVFNCLPKNVFILLLWLFISPNQQKTVKVF